MSTSSTRGPRRWASHTASVVTRTCSGCSHRPSRTGFARSCSTTSAVGIPTSPPTIARSTARSHGYARDVLEIVDEFADGPVVFVRHSVSAMIGLLAAIEAPERFAAQVMVGPSPCYINDGDYVGGFSRADIDNLLETLEGNYLGWSSSMAPAIMGAPEQPELGVELTNSFCGTDPEIAKHFARVTFLSDHRADLARSKTPALILQCSDDLIAPQSVGEYMQRALPLSTLCVIENVGYCPHLSAPSARVDAMEGFLRDLEA